MHQIDISAPRIAARTEKSSRAERAVATADRVGDFKASILARVIATAHELEISELFHHSRSRAPIAATRQLAMYMMHVVLGRSLTDVGKFYGRDRTTVAYACVRVEDMRDDLECDAQINDLELRYERAVKSILTAQNESGEELAIE